MRRFIPPSGQRVAGLFSCLVALFAAGLGWSLPAAAQRDGRIECRSSGYAYRECDTPFRNPVLVEQLSLSDCVEGRSWGVGRRGTVWVDEGCSGRFAEAGRHDGGYDDRYRDERYRPDYGSDDGGIECRSRGYAFERCGVPWRGARLVRQLSAASCDEGRGWGIDRDGLWVDNGCAGYFVEERGRGWGGGKSGSLVCESHGGAQARCRLPRGARDVRLDEQLSSTHCRRGDNWDVDGPDLWVAGGCRARFTYW